MFTRYLLASVAPRPRHGRWHQRRWLLMRSWYSRQLRESARISAQVQAARERNVRSYRGGQTGPWL